MLLIPLLMLTKSESWPKSRNLRHRWHELRFLLRSWRVGRDPVRCVTAVKLDCPIREVGR